MRTPLYKVRHKELNYPVYVAAKDQHQAAFIAAEAAREKNKEMTIQPEQCSVEYIDEVIVDERES